MSTKRLFFALWPDDRQRDRLRDVINAVAKTVEGRPVDRRSWHITLPFVGDIEERHIPDIQELVAQVQMEPFRLVFDRLEYWPRTKVACLAAAMVPAELEQLVASLNDVVQLVGVSPPDKTYRPHITVVRNARAFTTERLTQRVTTEWSKFELMESTSRAGDETCFPLKQ